MRAISNMGGQMNRSRRHVGIAAAVCAFFLLPASLARGAETGPGKQSAMTSMNFTMADDDVATPLSAEIVRGKEHNRLIVHLWVRLVSAHNADSVFWDNIVRVNGVSVEPTGGGTHQEEVCSPSCSRGATFWLDLDAAEAAHPHQFLGRPLDVTVVFEANTSPPGGAGSFTADLVVQMVP